MTDEFFRDQGFGPTFHLHAAPAAIEFYLRHWTKKNEAERVLSWLRLLQAHRATQVMRGEWPRRKDGNVSREELLAELNEKAEGDLHGYLTDSKAVYTEDAGESRWWTDIFKVVKIDDRLIGFMTAQANRDESIGELGWEFDPDTVREVEPYEVTVTKYREKKTYSSPAGAEPAPT